MIRATPRDDKPNAVVLGISGSRCGSRLGIWISLVEVGICVLLKSVISVFWFVIGQERCIISLRTMAAKLLHHMA